MIRSMTGFGQGSAESEGYRVSVDVRAVNHRFVDARIRLPAELAGFERSARERVLGSVRRGRVEVSVRLERTGSAGSSWTFNRPLARAVVEAARALEQEFGVVSQLDLATLCAVSGMFVEQRELGELPAPVGTAAGEALTAALEALQADREREGESLRADLLERLSNMRSTTSTIREHAADVPKRAREKLLERLSVLANGTELDPTRLAQEATFLADRADITEELVRLDAHLAEAARVLVEPDGEPVGRRMDFLVQEIHRETNTINSKSSELSISRAAMALKTETEKVREQVQNLE
jgi:uncharacterized protein (TIGR00255 family)